MSREIIADLEAFMIMMRHAFSDEKRNEIEKVGFSPDCDGSAGPVPSLLKEPQQPAESILKLIDLLLDFFPNATLYLYNGSYRNTRAINHFCAEYNQNGCWFLHMKMMVAAYQKKYPVNQNRIVLVPLLIEDVHLDVAEGSLFEEWLQKTHWNKYLFYMSQRKEHIVWHDETKNAQDFLQVQNLAKDKKKCVMIRTDDLNTILQASFNFFGVERPHYLPSNVSLVLAKLKNHRFFVHEFFNVLRGQGLYDESYKDTVKTVSMKQTISIESIVEKLKNPMDYFFSLFSSCCNDWRKFFSQFPENSKIKTEAYCEFFFHIAERTDTMFMLFSCFFEKNKFQLLENMLNLYFQSDEKQFFSKYKNTLIFFSRKKNNEAIMLLMKRSISVEDDLFHLMEDENFYFVDYFLRSFYNDKITISFLFRFFEYFIQNKQYSLMLFLFENCIEITAPQKVFFMEIILWISKNNEKPFVLTEKILETILALTKTDAIPYSAEYQHIRELFEKKLILYHDVLIQKILGVASLAIFSFLTKANSREKVVGDLLMMFFLSIIASTENFHALLEEQKKFTTFNEESLQYFYQYYFDAQKLMPHVNEDVFCEFVCVRFGSIVQKNEIVGFVLQQQSMRSFFPKPFQFIEAYTAQFSDPVFQQLKGELSFCIDCVESADPDLFHALIVSFNEKCTLNVCERESNYDYIKRLESDYFSKTRPSLFSYKISYEGVLEKIRDLINMRLFNSFYEAVSF